MASLPARRAARRDTPTLIRVAPMPSAPSRVPTVTASISCPLGATPSPSSGPKTRASTTNGRTTTSRTALTSPAMQTRAIPTSAARSSLPQARSTEARLTCTPATRASSRTNSPAPTRPALVPAWAPTSSHGHQAQSLLALRLRTTTPRSPSPRPSRTTSRSS